LLRGLLHLGPDLDTATPGGAAALEKKLKEVYGPARKLLVRISIKTQSLTVR
jgi:hypothetical protein